MFHLKYRIRMAFQFCMIICLMLCLWSCSISHPFDNDQNVVAIESFSYGFSADQIIRFEIDGINGDIDITGTEHDSIEVWGDRIVRSNSESDAKAHLALLQVTVQTSDSMINVKTEQPDESNGRNYEVIYHVRLPQSLIVLTGQMNGNISVQNLKTDISCTTMNGNVECQEIEGSCAVSVMNGKIGCDLILANNGHCTLTTMNGNISLEIPDTSSANLEVHVTNGSISVQALNVSNQKTSKTMFSGKIGEGEGSIQLQTVNGNIEVTGK